MRISLIINPPEPDVLESFRPPIERLRRAGHEVRPQLTFEAGDGQRMAREACERSSDLVIAAGGDGTVNEVVNGVQDFLSRCPAGATARGAPRLGIVPLGTANDLAAALELPTDVAAALQTAVGGRVVEADVGVVGDRCFINVSTGGFGAEASEEAPTEVKRALGPLAYVITGATKFVSLEVSTARFMADEVIYDGGFLLFAVGNFRRTGGGNWLTPRADLSDGLLDLCVIKEMSRVDFLKLLPSLRNGSHLDHPAVVYRQVPEVRVRSEAEISVNADGEPLSGRDFHYRISPHRIRLMVPPG